MVSRRRSQLEITTLILELDLGNTRVKWRIVKDDVQVMDKGVAELSELLNGHFPAAWCVDIRRARIASVLSRNTETIFAEQWQSQYNFSVEFARSSAQCGGVVNAYSDVTRLGVDRWLALLAAYNINRCAAVIVDVGTALKVDAVSDAGLHLGGYIIPGPLLMERALLEGTDRVRFESAQVLSSIALGVDTRSCVQNGSAAASVGAVLIALEEIRNKLGRQPAIYLTGGAGDLLATHLARANVVDIFFRPDLVLDGLRWALP